MMDAKQKTLRLINEHSSVSTEAGQCSTCDFYRRQLDHVHMLLAAAQLAATKKPEKPKGKR